MADETSTPTLAPCPVKLNGRVTDIKKEESDRRKTKNLLHRLFVRQSDPGCITRTFVPIIGEEQAKALLEGIKESDLVDIKGHVEESDEWNSLIVVDQIIVVEEIDEYLYYFEVTGLLEKFTRKKLPARTKGGRSSRVYELQVGGVHLKIFDSAAQAEASDVSKGSVVKAEGYVKSYINGEQLRSSLYVTSIEESPRAMPEGT